MAEQQTNHGLRTCCVTPPTGNPRGNVRQHDVVLVHSVELLDAKLFGSRSRLSRNQLLEVSNGVVGVAPDSELDAWGRGRAEHSQATYAKGKDGQAKAMQTRMLARRGRAR